MTKKDYYEILELSRNADSKQVKQAYRRLAMQLHPDRNPGDKEAEEKFKEAAEAYEILSNPEKRELYDRYGHEGLHGQSGFTGVDDIFSSFGDIFSDFFGGDIFGGQRRSRPPRPTRGADLRYDLKLSFEESIRGVRKDISLTTLRKCANCDGSGAEPGTLPEACPTCGGQGQVIQQTGFMTLATTCPSCNGTGHWNPSPCGKCEGTGRAPFERTVTATVPAGVDSGMRLRLGGEGEDPESGGEPGDLYIFIEVEQDEFFVREGSDLLCTYTISYTRAILGDTIEVELFDKLLKVDVPPGTQPGAEIRVKGRGAPAVGRSPKGDLVVELEVSLPKKTSSEQRKLLERLERLHREYD